MFENLIKNIRGILDKKVCVSDFEDMVSLYDKEYIFIEGNLYRMNILKNKQKVLSIDYIVNIFNETIVVKKVNLYLESL